MRHELLTVEGLANHLYEGSGAITNLAEELARTHGQAEALTFYTMMDEDTKNFWRGIAKQLIDHAREWNKNEGSCCMLSDRERKRLAELPRIDGSETTTKD